MRPRYRLYAAISIEVALVCLVSCGRAGSSDGRPEGVVDQAVAGVVRPEASPEPGPTASPTPTPPATPAPEPSISPVPKAAEPQRVVVQHILVSFGDKIPGKAIPRTQDQAGALAAELIQRARKGEDFDLLVKQNTDDQHPGIYALCNNGVRPVSRDEYPRQGMVGCFGDLSFSLAVGEIGMCDFDAKRSPYGWHIIKRIK